MLPLNDTKTARIITVGRSNIAQRDAEMEDAEKLAGQQHSLVMGY